jgi:hypothetical protein
MDFKLVVINKRVLVGWGKRICHCGNILGDTNVSFLTQHGTKAVCLLLCVRVEFRSTEN